LPVGCAVKVLGLKMKREKAWGQKSKHGLRENQTSFAMKDQVKKTENTIGKNLQRKKKP